jgi:hypothetical protein
VLWHETPILHNVKYERIFESIAAAQWPGLVTGRQYVYIGDRVYVSVQGRRLLSQLRLKFVQ